MFQMENFAIGEVIRVCVQTKHRLNGLAANRMSQLLRGKTDTREELVQSIGVFVATVGDEEANLPDDVLHSISVPLDHLRDICLGLTLCGEIVERPIDERPIDELEDVGLVIDTIMTWLDQIIMAVNK